MTTTMINPNHYILLVEDNADDRQILHRSFQEIHWSSKLKLVDSAEAAIQYLDSVPGRELPSLIVLDYHMHRTNGTETLMRLKQMESFKNIPVVLYAASMSALLAYRLTALGAFCCFHKPKDTTSALSLARTLKTIAEENSHAERQAALN